MSDFTPKAYVKTNCPFSFKFRLFALEAGLAKTMEFIELDVDASSHASEKKRTAVTGWSGAHLPDC